MKVTLKWLLLNFDRRRRTLWIWQSEIKFEEHDHLFGWGEGMGTSLKVVLLIKTRALLSLRLPRTEVLIWQYDILFSNVVCSIIYHTSTSNNSWIFYVNGKMKVSLKYRLSDMGINLQKSPSWLRFIVRDRFNWYNRDYANWNM